TDSFSELARILPENKPSGQICAVMQRANGELWVAGNYICRMEVNGDKLTLSLIPELSEIDFVDYVAVDSDDDFWAVKYKKGVYRYRHDGTLQSYLTDGEA
ncbi:MAG TPA: hypothetical protein DCW53_04960, partial [Rikenellaceae bacterium]|nr:hypothetical protein [Rikenellaceae bacterium]